MIIFEFARMGADAESRIAMSHCLLGKVEVTFLSFLLRRDC